MEFQGMETGPNGLKPDGQPKIGDVYYLKCSCKGKCNTDKCTCRSSEPKMDCIDLCTCSNSCENCDSEEGKSIERLDPNDDFEA